MQQQVFDSPRPVNALDLVQRWQITQTIGIAPRESLVAMTDYGLTDGEIARYYGLPRGIVTRLRQEWGIEGEP